MRDPNHNTPRRKQPVSLTCSWGRGFDSDTKSKTAEPHTRKLRSKETINVKRQRGDGESPGCHVSVEGLVARMYEECVQLTQKRQLSQFLKVDDGSE